jgi:hypothetical protein
MVVLHSSATDNPLQASFEAVKDLHVSSKSKYFKWGNYDTYGKGFSDIGYQYYIERNGTVIKGRAEEMAGAHCLGYNSISIGICLSGNTSFTSEQFKSLNNLLEDIKKRHNIDDIDILHHNELNINKTCPNFNWWEVKKELVMKKETIVSLIKLLNVGGMLNDTIAKLIEEGKIEKKELMEMVKKNLDLKSASDLLIDGILEPALKKVVEDSSNKIDDALMLSIYPILEKEMKEQVYKLIDKLLENKEA